MLHGGYSFILARIRIRIRLQVQICISFFFSACWQLTGTINCKIWPNVTYGLRIPIDASIKLYVHISVRYKCIKYIKRNYYDQIFYWFRSCFLLPAMKSEKRWEVGKLGKGSEKCRKIVTEIFDTIWRHLQLLVNRCWKALSDLPHI